MFKAALKPSSSRVLSPSSFLTQACRSKHTLPSLPYAYDALEPAISEQIMRLHHTKHHQTYVTNLNAAEEKLAAAASSGDVKAAIALQNAIRFNGGGHLNHTLFWENLAPASKSGGTLPDGALKTALTEQYGGLDAFIKAFNASLAGIQGSGWAWLVKDAESGRLSITTTPNQDPVTSGSVVLGVDAWEHAYYLQYENAKVKYFDAIWSVMNWEVASKRYGA